MSAEEMATHKELEARTAAVFSREDMAQALTVRATHIPKTPGSRSTTGPRLRGKASTGATTASEHERVGVR